MDQTINHAAALERVLMALIKDFGSQMKPHEYSLIIPADQVQAPKQWERLGISMGENGEAVLRVYMDEDVAKQVEALNQEYTATGDVVAPVEEVASGS